MVIRQRTIARSAAMLLATSCAAATFAAGSARAEGNHYGWCIGVGNPHHSANCGSGGTDTGISTVTGPGTGTLTGPDTGTSLPLPGTANPLPPTTGTYLVPPLPILTAPQILPTIIPPQPVVNVPGRVPQPAQVLVPPQPPGLQEPGRIPGQPVVNVPGRVPQPAQVLVPPQPPGLQEPGRIPPLLPNRVPQIVQLPGQVPIPVPRPVPIAVPAKVPFQKKPDAIVHVPQKPQTQLPVAVTGASGRQPAHAIPRFVDQGTGERFDCYASGHGRRKVLHANGSRSVSGHLPHLYVPDAIAADVPAERHMHGDCSVKIKRRVKRN